MICPNITNKQVVKQFNEIVEALGGTALIEEEFKSSDLRSKRTGIEYAAMEATYKIWHMNNGNSIDYAPNGAQSILFRSLLDVYKGDRRKAILAKSNIYTQKFLERFGKWNEVDNFNINNVDLSKVDIVEVTKPWKNDPSKHNNTIRIYLKGQHEKGYFEIVKDHEIGYFSVHFKTKNEKGEGDSQFDSSTKEERSILYEQLINVLPELSYVSTYGSVSDGGVYALNKIGKTFTKIGERDAISKHNQEKLKLNIYQKSETNKKLDINGEPFVQDVVQKKHDNVTIPDIFMIGSVEDFFGKDIAYDLDEKNPVTSDQIMSMVLQSNMLNKDDMRLAIAISGHSIPIFIDRTMDKNKIAETITDVDGNSVIVINPNVINHVTKQYIAKALMHEIVHAVTVTAIDKPTTKYELKFAELNRKVFNRFSKLVSQNISLLSDIESGLYAFSNQKEFSAVFITDPAVRSLLRSIAKEADINNNGKFTLYIKDFINGITQLFFNKTAFDTNVSLLDQYKKEFEEYLRDIPTKSVGENTKMSEAIKMYRKIDGSLLTNESILDFFKRIGIYKNALQSNALRIGPLQINRNASNVKNKYTYQEVYNMLHTRLKALSSTSTVNMTDRTRLISETQIQMDMFNNDFTSKYSAISEIVRTVGPQLLNDIDELESKLKIGEDISGDQYMYHAHANIGMYERLTSTLIIMLQNDDNIRDMIDFYNKDKQESEKINIEDIEALKNNVKHMNSVCKEGLGIIQQILNKITAKTLINVRNEVGAKDLDSYINKLAAGDPLLDEDISKLEVYAGSADSSASPLIKTLSYILGKAKRSAEEETLYAMEDVMKNSKGLILTKLYEKAYGKYTQYFIRKRKYGQFYIDYDAEMAKINEAVNKKYGLSLSKDNRIAPESNQDAKREWHKMRNDWLDKHADRKYVKKYYEAQANLPEIARQALQSYNNEINSILTNERYIKDGQVKYELISDDDWKKLQHLYVYKKLLRSEYDMYGNKKEGEALVIANALNEFYNTLYGDKKNRKQPKKNVAAWKAEMNNVIEECGGQEAFQKYREGKRDEESGFNSSKWKKWESRNVNRVIKRDENGEGIVWKKIKEQLRGLEPDYGKEYEDLKQRAQDLLSPFKDEKGEVIAYELSEAIKRELINIYSKMKSIRENTKGYKKLAERTRKIYEMYIKNVDTEYYKQIQESINAQLMEDDDLDLLNSEQDYYYLLSEYGTPIFDYDTNEILEVVPYKWLQKVEAVDEQYMDYEPSNAWIEKDDNSDLINPNFDESEGVSMVPKMKYYENKEFDKIMSDQRYKKLYDSVLSLMEKANKKQSNRQFKDNFLIPSISGTLLHRIKQSGYGPYLIGGKVNAIFQWFKEKIGLSRNTEDDTVEGVSLASDMSTNEVDQLFDKHKNSLRGKYPDGRPFNMIPQYYTKRMKDPSIISTDLINVLFQYYLMSASYEKKQNVRGDCEALLDMIQNKYYLDSNNNALAGGTNTDESNVYKFARAFLEMNLYNLRRQQLNINLKNVNINLQYTKTLELWKEYATARNLGANPKVAITGMFTSSYVHLINQITGSLPGIHDKYNLKLGCSAFVEVMIRLIRNKFGASYIGNTRSNDKLMLLMEQINMSSQMDRKFKYNDRNRLARTVSGNYIYGFLSSLDFFIKSQIAVTEHMAYKFVDGEFMTLSDLYYNRKYIGENAFYDKLKKFNNAPSLYSLLYEKDGKLTIDDKYKTAYHNIKYVVESRSEKTAENADGMATQLQKNVASSNIIGALIQMHRQFLPLTIQESLGQTVYDYDTQRYKNGQFRTLFNMTSDLMKENLLAGIVAGTGVGVAFGGVLGGVIGGSIVAPLMRWYGIRHKKGSEKGCKKIIQKYLNDYSSVESSHKSYTNRNNIAKTIVEILLFNLIMQPAITAICKSYDDDDRWYIQLLLFTLRALSWEAYTKYRTTELFNNVKTATSATSVTDGLMEVSQGLEPFVSGMLDPRLYNEQSTQFNLFGDDITKGPYEGHSKAFKAAAKWLPWHNAYEQYADPKAKRKYFESQIQKLPESER